MNLITRKLKPFKSSGLIKISFCCVLIILPSCQTPDLRLAESSSTLPAAYSNISTTTAKDANPNTEENSSKLGYEEFYSNPLLTKLIQQGLANNRELKMLNEEVEIASNEILARRGAYLPFVTFGSRAGLDKSSEYSTQGAVERQLEYLPGRNFPDPLPTFGTNLNLFWQIDIWRELRNARDAAILRYQAACEKRNYFVTKLIADIAENYYNLLAIDKRIETLDKTIELQEQSLTIAKLKKDTGRGTELAVQRFQAEVRKNQSEKLIAKQEIVETENRINLLLNRLPEPVERSSTAFLDLSLHAIQVGLPCQLLQNRPDIRQAERELTAAGLDIKVARAHFYPRLDISAGVGYQAFNTKYLFLTPESLIYGVAGDLTAPLINKAAIKAEFMTANAKQLQSIYNYQKVVLNAYIEVMTRVSMVENYRKSIDLKIQQLESLESSVDVASKLFQNARAEYVEVLLAQRDMLEARMVLIETKKQQLAAMVNAYQALGGGSSLSSTTRDLPLIQK